METAHRLGGQRLRLVTSRWACILIERRKPDKAQAAAFILHTIRDQPAPVVPGHRAARIDDATGVGIGAHALLARPLLFRAQHRLGCQPEWPERRRGGEGIGAGVVADLRDGLPQPAHAARSFGQLRPGATRGRRAPSANSATPNAGG